MISTVSAAPGDTIYVNGSSGNDSWDGLSAAWTSGTNGPKLSIKNATSTVNQNGTVKIANGVYTGINNTNITINKNMTLNGQSQTGTIINGTNSNWIFNIQSGVNVAIFNLTFANGKSTSNGGAIYNYGTLTVNDGTFTNNAATNGGAIYNYGTLIVNNSTFTNNAATYGGAIYNNGGTLTVTSSAFTGNTASDYGGAIRNAGHLTVTSSTFTGNTANDYGGAIYNYGTLNNVAVTGSTFIDNTANDAGGAIYNNGGTFAVNSRDFTGNTANDAGGAIYNNGGTFAVTSSAFTGNTANDAGGAIYNNGTVMVTKSNFTGNAANDYGGAIYNNGGTCTVTSNDFTGNIAGNGGAIYTYSTLIVHFNRLIGNIASQGSDIYNSGGAVDANYNWWGSNNSPTGIYGTTVSNWFVLNITASQTLIPMLGTSTITADLTHDNLGNYYNPLSGHIPDGTIASFGGILGSVKSGSVGTTNGQATTIFKAGSNSGTTPVYAIVDNTIANTSITIFTVMTDIYVSTTGSDTTGDGTQSKPYQTILRGISAVPSGGTLHIANGVYTGAGNKNIVIAKDINIIGQSSSTIINGESTSRLFTIISGTTVTIQNLTFANGNATSNGGAIYNAGNLTITGSTFTNNAAIYGGAIYNTGTSTVHFSRIIGNTASQGSAIYNSGGTVDANNNWWGSNASPAGRIYGANVTSWLVLTITASSTLIKNGGISTITADLLHDNKGNYHNPTLGHVPNGIIVKFTTKLGTIGNQSSTVNGIAKSNLKGGSISGTTTVSALIDNQTMQKSVVIDNIPPKVISTYPKNKATGCSRTANIYLKFSESIKSSVNWSKIVVKDKYGHKVAITKWISGNTLYIKTNSKRLSYSYYTVYIPSSAVKDNAGNNLAKSYTFKFKTGK
jgi:autotransporter family porin